MNKAALIGAMVLMISIVPAFALNDTSNTTNGTGDQTQTQSQSGNCDNQNCQKNCNGGTCDGDGHKYQYGQDGATGADHGNCDQQHKYQYGMKNGNADAKNCTGNCPNQ